MGVVIGSKSFKARTNNSGGVRAPNTGAKLQSENTEKAPARGYLFNRAAGMTPFRPVGLPRLTEPGLAPEGPKLQTAKEILGDKGHKELVLWYLKGIVDAPPSSKELPGFRESSRRLLGLIESNERLNYEDGAHLVVATFRAGDYAEAAATKKPVKSLQELSEPIPLKLASGEDLNTRERAIAIRGVVGAGKNIAALQLKIPSQLRAQKDMSRGLTDLNARLWNQLPLTPSDREFLQTIFPVGKAHE